MKYCWLILLMLLSILVKGQEPQLVVPIGHTGIITSLAYSHNGNFLVSGSVDNTAKLWDIKTARLLKTFASHTLAINHVAFSHNDKLIATASEDATVIIWSAEDGRKISTLQGHSYGVSYISFSYNGQLLATASWDGTVKIWNTLTGSLLHNLKGHDDKVIKVLFSHDDNLLFSASEDNNSFIWQVSSGKLIHKLEAHKHVITDIAYNNEKKQLATTSLDKSFKIWSTETGELLANYTNSNSSFVGVEYSPSNQWLAATSEEGLIVLWDVALNKIHKVLKTNCKQNRTITFCNNSTQLIANANSETLQILSIETGIVTKTIQHKGKITARSFNEKQGVVFSADNNYTIQINSLVDGNVFSEIKNSVDVPYYSTAVFSSDGANIFLPSNQGTARCWNICTASTKWANTIKSTNLRHVALSANEQYVAMSSETSSTGNADSTINVYNASNGVLLYSFKGSYYFNTPICFSNKGSVLAFASATGNVNLVNIETGKLLQNIKLGRGYVVQVTFSKEDDFLEVQLRDGNDVSVVYDLHENKIISSSKRFVTIENSPKPTRQSIKVLHTFRYGNVYLYNPFSSDTLANLQGHTKEITKVVFSDNGKLLATICKDSSVRLFDVATGNLLHQWKSLYSDYNLLAAKFLQNDSLLLIAVDTLLQVYEVKSGKNIFIATNSAGFGNIVFHQNYLLNTSLTGIFQLWNLQTYSIVYSFVLFKQADYLAQEPTGYYKATSHAAKMLHYVTQDFKVISFEQLDVQYNRPDKVLQYVNCADSAIIKSYTQAYNKRISKLKIDTTVFSKTYEVPSLTLVAFKNKTVQTAGLLKLHLEGSSKKYNIRQCNIWVNDVPLFGINGIQYNNSNKFTIDTFITLQLSAGDNRIEASILNTNGLESYRFPLYQQHTPSLLQKPKVYFIGIGINQFANAAYNLSWSVKDIRDLAKKLKEKYPEVLIDTLFDKQVTYSNIVALKKKLLQLNVNDKVIVSYSGHGVLNKNFDYFLSTYSIDFNKPEDKGLAYEVVENLLDKIQPRQKLLLIDACHSGEVDKDEIAKIEAAKSTLNNNGVTTKSTIKVVKKEKQLGMANSFELMQNLFVNVGKGTGATIISAAGGMQYAQESGDLKNGVFTYSLIEAFNQNTVLKVSELKKKVSERVIQLTNGLQKPTSRNETNNYDWVVW